MTQTTYIKIIITHIILELFTILVFYGVLNIVSTRIHFTSICNTHNVDSDLRVSRRLFSRYAGILCVFYSVLRQKH